MVFFLFPKYVGERTEKKCLCAVCEWIWWVLHAGRGGLTDIGIGVYSVWRLAFSLGSDLRSMQMLVSLRLVFVEMGLVQYKLYAIVGVS